MARGLTPRQRFKMREFEKNVDKRGFVAGTSKDKSEGMSVGPIILGFLLFVVVGSTLLQMINALL